MTMRSPLLALALNLTFLVAETVPAEVLVHLDQRGATLPADFIGLSTEKKLMNRDCFQGQNQQLIALYRNLGTGVLRIGANNVDSTAFKHEGFSPAETMLENHYVTEPRTIGPASVDAFFDFARATGWKVIYGVNLGSKDPAMSADEADYAWKVGAKEILAVEIGNEPNLYPKSPTREGIRPGNWGYADYKAEFTAVADAIRAKNPQIPLTGPAVTKGTKWMPLFMADFKDRIVLATSHVYPLSAKQADPQHQRFTSVEKLLGEKYPDDWIIKLHDAQAVGVPYRIDECNTASDGGKRGVSDAFASTLWSIDFMFDVALAGGQGVNFHGSFTPNNYSAIVFEKKTRRYVPAPLYYGLLFFSRAAQGQLIDVTTKSDANFIVRGTVDKAGKLRLVLLNKDLNKTVNVHLPLGDKFSQAHAWRLVAPSVSATSGVTFAGAEVDATGNWAPKTIETIPVADHQVNLSVSATSAVLLILE